MRDEEKIENIELHCFAAAILIMLGFLLSWFAYNLALAYPQTCDWVLGRTIYTVQCQLNALKELK